MPVDVEQRVGGGCAEQGAPVQAHLQDPLTRPNKTGLPDPLKSGIESLSGYSMDDVKVHYNSAKPAQLQAHAYAQGNNIHVASGQERHLAHEAWHVVQQKQGRVEPTRQFKGGPTNESLALEAEADAMGAKAASGATGSQSGAFRSGGTAGAVTQLRRATSRGNNPRTYVLPQAVKDHIFTNNHDGTGFHATTREQPKIAKVRQIDGRDRGAEAYRARHRNKANTADVGPEKSMFPMGQGELATVYPRV